MSWGNAWGTRSWGGGARVIQGFPLQVPLTAVMGRGAVPSPGYLTARAVTATHLLNHRYQTDFVTFPTVITTSSVSPSANRLQLCLVAEVGNGSTTGAPSVSGCGLTWVPVATVLTSPPGAGDDTRLSLFRAMGTSPSSGSLTVTCTVAQRATMVFLDEFANVDQSGTNGSGAVVQSSTNQITGMSLTVSLSAFANPLNATYGGFQMDYSFESWHGGSGFTVLGSDVSAFPSNGALTEFKPSADTTVDASLDDVSGEKMSGIAVEIAVGVTTSVVAASVSGVGTVNGASTQTFTYTGGPQTFTVPPGITLLTVDVQGAKGGNQHVGSGRFGGLGGRTQCVIPVTPGEVLTLQVGGQGVEAGPGGYNGGGGGAAVREGSGGGASDIRRGAASLADRLVVAGGGGGAGGVIPSPLDDGGNGGNGSGGNGSNGDPDAAAAVQGGGGGTTSAGGFGGVGVTGNGFTGALGVGGDGAAYASASNGGGGGGGYYGGGGGGAGDYSSGGGGGGGGSGLGTGINQTLTSGFRSGDGQITLSWSPLRLAETVLSPVSGTGTVRLPTVIPRLPIIPTNLTTMGSGSDDPFYDTTNVTPAAGALILVTVINTGAQTTPTLSGCGMTWASVYTSNFGAFARYSMFRGMSSSPSTGQIRADFGGVSQTGCTIVVDQLDHVDQSGSNGSGAIVQDSTLWSSGDHGGGAGTGVAVLGGFSSVYNGTYGLFANIQTTAGGTGTPSPGSGFTTVATSATAGPPAMSVISEWTSANATNVGVSWASGAGGVIGSAIEVVPLIPVSVTVPLTCVSGTGSVANAQAAPSPNAVIGTGSIPAPFDPVVAFPATLVGIGTVEAPIVVGADLAISAAFVAGVGTVRFPLEPFIILPAVILGTGTVQTAAALAFIIRLISDPTGLSDTVTAHVFVRVFLAAWTADQTRGARISTDAVASLSIPVPAVPFPSPGNWEATATADVTSGATSIPVDYLGVNMPTGAVIFFPDSTVILSQAANPGDTTLHVRPVNGYITSGHTGSGGAPAPSAPGVGQPPAAPHWGPWDGFRPLRRTSLRYPKPVLNADGLPT